MRRSQQVQVKIINHVYLCNQRICNIYSKWLTFRNTRKPSNPRMSSKLTTPRTTNYVFTPCSYWRRCVHPRFVTQTWSHTREHTYVLAGLAMLAQPGVTSAARAPQRRPAPLDIESCMEHVERGTCPCVKNCWSLLQHSLKCPSSVMMDMRLQLQETPRNKQSSYIS